MGIAGILRNIKEKLKIKLANRKCIGYTGCIILIKKCTVKAFAASEQEIDVMGEIFMSIQTYRAVEHERYATFKEFDICYQVCCLGCFWRGKFDLSDIYGTACKAVMGTASGKVLITECRASANLVWRRLASTRKTGLLELSSQISRKIRGFLYVSFCILTIGGTIPRCATVSFTSWNRAVYFRRREDGRIRIFSLYFAVVLFRGSRDRS